MTMNSLNKTKHEKDSKNTASENQDTFSSNALIQSTIRVVAATVVLLFLFVFGDAFAQGIVDVYAAILGGRSVDNEALCSFILRILQIVMTVVTAGFSIETLLRIIRNYKRRKHHGSES